MRWTGETTFSGGDVYEMDVRDGAFVHFTTVDRAIEILQDGYLRMDPPYQKFGTDTVNAVSTHHGQYWPGVQTDHIGDDIAAVLFTTDTVPQYGYAEETVWRSDVRLINPELIDLEEAVRLIDTAPNKLQDQDQVVYR